jgi:hypothetical protein
MPLWWSQGTRPRGNDYLKTSEDNPSLCPFSFPLVFPFIPYPYSPYPEKSTCIDYTLEGSLLTPCIRGAYRDAYGDSGDITKFR